MRLTVGELLDVVAAVGEVGAAERLPLRVAVPLARWLAEARRVLEDVESQRRRLLSELAEVDPDTGEVLRDPDGRPRWRSPEAEGQFLREWRDLLATAIDVPAALPDLEALPPDLPVRPAALVAWLVALSRNGGPGGS